MKKIHYILGIVGVASVLSFPVIAADVSSKATSSSASDGAAPHHKGMEHDGKGPFGHPPFDQILSLTDAQKQTLKAAHEKQEPAMHDLHEKIHAAHEALNKAGDTKADDATLTKLSNDLAALLAQQEVARVKAHQQLVSILTPEQKQKLDAFMAEHKDGHDRERKWK